VQRQHRLPTNNQQPQPPPQITQREARPQIACLVDREYVDKLGKVYSDLTKTVLGSEPFVKFCQAQVDECQRAQMTIPMNLDPQEYFLLANDFRLLWRFWNDLLQYAKETQQEITTE
jgi:hypothetical protein